MRHGRPDEGHGDPSRAPYDRPVVNFHDLGQIELLRHRGQSTRAELRLAEARSDFDRLRHEHSLLVDEYSAATTNINKLIVA